MEKILLFLTGQFRQLLDVNLTVCFVIAFVLCVRQFIKRAPKIFSYALWGIVLVRLLVPISLESPVSFVPEKHEFSSMVEINQVLPELEFETPEDRADNAWVRENTPAGEPFKQVSRSISADTYLTIVWVAGIVVLLLWSAASFWKLRRKVRIAVPYHKGIFIADDIDMPFVMGIFRPVIYLPGSLEAKERRYIIAHERHHIRRGDHIFKMLGFLALSIYWFNPLVWVAFVLSGRDMEMSCDEAVIRKLGADIRADYSASLLNLAAGHRLFSITPLAFGEGDTTGRVRNLARWKKPAVWIIVVCIVVCAVLSVCLLTNRETDVPENTVLPETESTTLAQVHPPQPDDWGVSLVPDRVSRTGATALFAYGGSVPGREEAELIFGDFLSLDVLEDGSWVPVEELAEYDYFVGDATYPVVDGYGMVHEWPQRFGELPDGHYRMGKQVTLVQPDGSSESRMVYGEFLIPGSIRTGLIPLEELPELYSGEQAIIDGCFVQSNGIARENLELFQEFTENTWNGLPGVVRIVNWFYGDDSHWYAHDLHFDGELYTLVGLEESYTFRYLKHYEGVFDEWTTYSCFVLTNDDSLTWQEVEGDNANNAAHWTVYSAHTYVPRKPQLPQNPVQAVLEFKGEPLITITDFDRLEKIWILFSEAELLGYEPKTHSVGVGLNLILKSQSGETTTIELNPDSDICRINGEFVFYGAYDEPDYIEKLWYYLDIPQWPDVVYASCENALRPQ